MQVCVSFHFEETIVDLKAERMNCSLSTEEKSCLLNGFVCNTCFKVLENYPAHKTR